MKYFSLNKLKKKSFTPAKALNDVVNITLDNISAAQKDVKSLLNDIEKIREGLTLKNEELKRKLENKKPDQCISEFEAFEKQFDNKNLSEVAAIKHILTKHAYLDELKVTNRTVYILKEINDGNKEILDKLLENEDEWNFLCGFLQRVILINENPDLHLFLKSMQIKTEERIVKDFEKAFAKRDKLTMKKCYEALQSVNRQEIVVKSFLYLLPLFNEDHAKYEEVSEIELEGDVEVPCFVSYIDNIEESINTKFCEFIPVFEDYETVLDTICKDLYENAIYNRLEEVLNTKNPVLYLLNLKTCFLRVRRLTESIKNISVDLSIDDFLDDLFKPYIQTAIDKEKAAFEIFFDLVARKKDSSIRLLLHGELLLNTDPHPTVILSKLIKLYNEALCRSKLFGYSVDGLDEYKNFVLKKLKELINLVCGNFTEPDRLKLIKQLCDTYLIVRKIFSGDDQLYEFKDAVDDRIEILFNNRIEESEAKHKHIIKKLTIREFEDNNTNTMIKLCENIRRDSKLCSKYINGTNKDVFMTRLLQYTQTKLYSQYISLSYDKEQSKIFARDMNMIYELVREMNLANVFGMYEHLVELSEMIDCRKEDVVIYVNILQHKIPYNEVKKILKCRNDYYEVKHTLEK